MVLLLATESLASSFLEAGTREEAAATTKVTAEDPDPVPAIGEADPVPAIGEEHETHPDPVPAIGEHEAEATAVVGQEVRQLWRGERGRQ